MQSSLNDVPDVQKISVSPVFSICEKSFEILSITPSKPLSSARMLLPLPNTKNLIFCFLRNFSISANVSEEFIFMSILQLPPILNVVCFFNGSSVLYSQQSLRHRPHNSFVYGIKLLSL